MKNKIWAIIIVLIGLIDFGYGIYKLYNNYQFKEKALITKANIYGISYQENNKKILYVDFYVKNKKYDGIILTTNNDIEKNDSIKIYYDKNNPKIFTDGNISKSPYIIIGIGLIIIAFGTTLLLIKK